MCLPRKTLGHFVLLVLSLQAVPVAGQVTVTVSPSTVSVPRSGFQQFIATVTSTNNHDVTWTVQEGNGRGTIDPGGGYYPPGGAGSVIWKYRKRSELAAGSGSTSVTSVGPESALARRPLSSDLCAIYRQARPYLGPSKTVPRCLPARRHQGSSNPRSASHGDNDPVPRRRSRGNRKLTGHRSREMERYEHLSQALKRQTVTRIANLLTRSDTATDTPYSEKPTRPWK